MSRKFDSTRDSLPVKALVSHRFLPTVAVMMVAYQCFATDVDAKAANQSVTPRSATKASAKTSARSYQVPEWWRREWRRREQVRWFESKLLAREVKTDSKAMWNPRSPQAIAYRRAWLLSHPKRQAQSAVSPNSATVSRRKTKSSGPSGISQ